MNDCTSPGWREEYGKRSKADRSPHSYPVPKTLDRCGASPRERRRLAGARARETAIESIAEMQRVVVIDSGQDPGNLGAIVRTAAAAGFDAVVTGPGTADLWSTRAIRASAGPLFALHMAKRVDLESSLDLLRVAGHSVLATDVRGETSVYQVEIEKRMTLVVGSEAHGLSETIIDRTDAMIRVPMGPLVESLNVAVATGIVMYRMQEEGQDE